ncbi:hypothetical protein LOTGIDRAFT_183025 [Lottia gigantea]|uniref:Thioredoxin domain-containing protein n=1 Tax=Lottia gigantea TaxID=225164 RepID=V3ZD88_LOTGI|nr:hypothetical protein LOTGIDRAFT_183025 [Lottia gigantea]ESO89073.1 hypothetical protein LOTGIDRAFT_183025 [Lottia gigantea]
MSAIEEILKVKKVRNNKGEEVDVSSFCGKDKYVGLYFSAHWCPPCKGFTPVLAEFYNKLNAEGKKLEIIFISSDRSAEEFKNYFDSMPWLAIDISETDITKQIKEKYGIRGIPNFTLLDGETGETIHQNARNEVTSDTEGKNFPWK